MGELKQEVYVRLLRIDGMGCLHKPLAYLYTIAANVMTDVTLAGVSTSHRIASTGQVREGSESGAT